MGDFYYELGVQIVEVCLATSHRNGGTYLLCHYLFTNMIQMKDFFLKKVDVFHSFSLLSSKIADYRFIIIIMYIYHALINALSTNIMYINLNTIFCTHVEDSPTKTIYIRHYMDTHTHTHICVCARTHTHTHTHTMTVAETGY